MRHPRASIGVHTFGVRRMHTTTLMVDKPYGYNGKFKLSGKYARGDRFDFPSEHIDELVQPSGDYSTLYGWLWAFNGHIFGKTNSNLGQAVFRLIGVRKPLSPNHEVDMRTRQHLYVIANHDRVFRNLWHLAPKLPSDYTCLIDELVRELLTMPHDKQDLRINAFNEYVNDGTDYKTAWIRSGEVKLKPGEIAKFGKYGRVIVDLGVAASLQGVLYALYFKSMVTRELIIGRSIFYYVSSLDDAIVTHYLNRMIVDDQSYDMILIASGDDASLAVRDQHGNMLRGNMDISSCDASITPTMLDSVLKLMQCPREVDTALREMLLAPCNLYCSRTGKNEHRERVTITPTMMYLPSGVPITSLAGTLAVYYIFHSLVDSVITCSNDVVDAAKAVGFDITFEAVEKPEDYQFLKRSLAKNIHGDYKAVLNLGVILRASGRVRGDLPGRGCLMRRGREFQRALMEGLLSGINNPELRLLQPEAADITIGKEYSRYGSREYHSYTLDSLVERYSFDSKDTEEFKMMLSEVSFGQTAYSRAAEKILLKDYGLGLP